MLVTPNSRSSNMKNILTLILVRIAGPTATCSTTLVFVVFEALLDGWTGCSSLGFGVHLKPTTGTSNHSAIFVFSDLGHVELLNFSSRMQVAPS